MNQIHFLHGFLGSAGDWNIFCPDLKNHSFIFHSIENYMFPNLKGYKTYFSAWLDGFHSSLVNQNHSNKKILVGYSLGGRLALHSLVSSNLWDAAIIISANPGLKDESEKQSRIKNDTTWALRFQNEGWDEVLKDWNSQTVFANFQNSLCREEYTINKHAIKEMLINFSLGNQENLREEIKLLNIPILWLAGERDSKFVEIAIEMQESSNNILAKIIPNAGHRVPWDNPKEFINTLNSFLDNI